MTTTVSDLQLLNESKCIAKTPYRYDRHVALRRTYGLTYDECLFVHRYFEYVAYAVTRDIGMSHADTVQAFNLNVSLSELTRAGVAGVTASDVFDCAVRTGAPNTSGYIDQYLLLRESGADHATSLATFQRTFEFRTSYWATLLLVDDQSRASLTPGKLLQLMENKSPVEVEELQRVIAQACVHADEASRNQLDLMCA